MVGLKETNNVTAEDLSDLLSLAKIDENCLTKVSQVLYATSTSKDDFKLLEVNEDLLQSIRENDCLSFRGNPNDFAVLCTKDKTYEIREDRTSNTWLLIPDLKFSKDTQISSDKRIIESREVIRFCSTYFEACECKPDMSRLPVILESTTFNGIEYESLVDQDSYSWDKLRGEIQASDGEFQKSFLYYTVVILNGYCRLVSFKYELDSVTRLVDFIDANSWQLDEIDKESTFESLKDLVIEPVLELIFRKYTNVSEKTNNGKTLYRLKEAELCALLARALLLSCPVNEEAAFMDAWKSVVPEKITPKAEYLKGIALTRWNGSRQRTEIVPFEEKDLSRDFQERFDQLFKAKEKWTLEEITPYLTNVTTSKLNVNGLLAQYTRVSTVNNVRYYSSKHDK